jgi:general secretion pathway protein D
MSMAIQRASVTGVCAGHRANPVATCRPAIALAALARAGVVLAILLAGCRSHSRTETAVELEKPKVANGVIVEPNDSAKIEQMAAAVDSIDLATPQKTATPDSNAASPARVSVAEAVDMTVRGSLPAESTKTLPLPKLSRTEINEIVEHMVQGFETSHGYVAASPAIADAMPIAPAGILGDRTVARSGEGGTHVLRFGYRCFVSQPPQFWALGVVVGSNGALSVNPDLAQVEPKVTQILASLREMRAGLTVRDLETRLIQLSYVDAITAINMLKGFGITTLNQPAEVPPQVDFAKLPYVVNIEDPKKEYTGLVGSKEANSSGKTKLSMAPGAASELMDNAIASPMTQIMVLFHPAYPEQFSEVRRILDTFVDRPARQIFIEAMVLEIGEQGLKELGVEWALSESPLFVNAGSLNAGASTQTLRINTPDTSMLNEIFEGEFEWDWAATIRALIRTGKAEILSRPSVLTLDNRQSTIRVGQDIPIASSLEGLGNSTNKVSFQFEYLPTGILLNIRPRINESGSEVSMLIDTIVSAKVPGEDLEMRSEEGTVLASAPTVSTRRVQTYGRIPNNTPLIIGGLVAREQTQTVDKVPLLGDLPVVGALFRSQTNESLKREVIIVLTPHVLPERREVLRAIPKDEDTFDSFGNTLFRDSYRIRSEDVYDLSFLLENRRIATYRDLARQAAQRNFRLATAEPFRSFVRDNVPGEPILVTRMIYEVIKRLDTASSIETPKIIYFDGQQVGGYTVKFIEQLLRDRTQEGVTDFGDQALAITYRYDRASLAEGRLGTEPIPEIRLLDCPDRKAWGKLLWELNQPLPDGQRRHTILLQNDSDIVRLRRALVLKKVAALNGGMGEMCLRNFSVGKVLLMPELKKGQIHVVDADTAMFFFHTEHYYAATLAEIERQLKELDQALRRPEIRMLLTSPLPEDSPTEGGK